MSRAGKIFLGIVLGTMLGLYGLYRYNFRTYNWNQKLTVEVEAPNGLVTGSAITRVTWRLGPPKLSVINNPSIGRVHGEATIVNIGNGRYLFALLRGSGANPNDAPERHIVKELIGADSGREAWDVVPDIYWRRGLADGAITLSPKNYPLLVTFDNINDPASVKMVQSDNVAGSLGPGVSLKRILLEVTSEPVTNGQAQELLPWLLTLHDKRATLIPNPPRFAKDAKNPLIQYLTPSAFSTELYRQ